MGLASPQERLLSRKRKREEGSQGPEYRVWLAGESGGICNEVLEAFPFVPGEDGHGRKRVEPFSSAPIGPSI